MSRRFGLVLALLAAPVPGRTDPALFAARCASCHAVVADAPVGAGPNLAGIVGRRVAADPRFDYSPVLREAGDGGEVWDRSRLARFLADPEDMYPGLWMGGNGLRRAAEIETVVEFLGTSAAR